MRPTLAQRPPPYRPSPYARPNRARFGHPCRSPQAPCPCRSCPSAVLGFQKPPPVSGASRGDELTVGRDGHPVDAPAVLERLLDLSSRHIPQEDAEVRARARQERPVAGEGERRDRIAMPPKR